jgi:hypothetical protein
MKQVSRDEWADFLLKFPKVHHFGIGDHLMKTTLPDKSGAIIGLRFDDAFSTTVTYFIDDSIQPERPL